MTTIQETQQGEIISIKHRSSNTPLREPMETDPVVTTLYDKYQQHGGQVDLTVEYEASSAVCIIWQRNGINCWDGNATSTWSPSTGKTSMIIKNANVQLHNHNRYGVIISDTSGRTVNTSAKVFVHY